MSFLHNGGAKRWRSVCRDA